MEHRHEIDYAWYIRSQECIAQEALTNSKRPACFVKGVYPTHLVRGKGCHVWDHQAKIYVDFICGLGSNILGYADRDVGKAASDAYAEGGCLSLGTPDEILFAELIKGIIPFIDKIKVFKTGSDACSAAVRIARAKTGRNWVLSSGYHGWHDEFISLTPPAEGVTNCLNGFYMDKFQSMDQLSGGIAAVIIEPVLLDYSDDQRIWLNELRRITQEKGIMLIFDEVITGFRFPKFCVSNYFGITPDLICLGKAMANGFPISVVGGKREIMECGEYFTSSTFAGERMAINAAITTINKLQTKKKIDYLWEKGGEFIRRFNEISKGIVTLEGYPTRGVFQGTDLNKALFFQESAKAGILVGHSWFFNFPHIDVMDSTLSTFNDIFNFIHSGMVGLEGEMPSSPFAAKVRDESETKRED